jgi:hypothetical protein
VVLPADRAQELELVEHVREVPDWSTTASEDERSEV